MRTKLITLKLIIILASSSIAQVPSYVPTNNLVAWYPFYGSTNDFSINALNATNYNALLDTDRFGNINESYYFDGNSSTYMETPHPSNGIMDVGTGSFSISLWFKTVASTNTTCLISKRKMNGGFHDEGFMVRMQADGQVNFEIEDNLLQPDTLLSGSSYNDNQWHHVVCVKNGADTTFQMYIDGELRSSRQHIPMESLTTTTNFYIGRYQNYPSAYFTGNLDDIGFWKKALTYCEVIDLFNSQLGSSETTSVITVENCEEYTWTANNETYTQSGEYTTVLTNVFGCDSTVTLDLTINEVNNGISQVDNITLQADATAATYQWIDCSDETIIVGATSQQFSPVENGDYAVIVTQNGCSDTTECRSVESLSLIDNDQKILSIYPNPAKETITISSDASIIGKTFSITNQLGQVVVSGKISQQEMNVDLNELSTGFYVIHIGGNQQSSFRIVKE